MLVGALCTVGYAYLAGPAVGILVPKASMPPPLHGPHPVVLLALLWVLLALGRGFASSIQQRSSSRLTENIIHDLRHMLFTHMLALKPQALERQGKGDVAARLTLDVAQLRHVLGVGLVSFARDGLTMAGLSLLLFRLQPFLAGVVLGCLPLIAWVVSTFTRRIRRLHQHLGTLQGQLIATLTETTNAAHELRHYHAEAYQTARFSEQTNALRDAHLKLTRLSSVMSTLIEALSALAMAGALIGVAFHTGVTALSTTAFVSFFAAAFLLYRPLLRLGSTLQQSTAGLVALERLKEFLNMPIEPVTHDVRVPPNEPAMLRARELCAGYDIEAPIIREMNLDVNAGSLTAIVGPSGAGKSTLLNTLLGNLEHCEGLIQWQDASRTTYSAAEWRRKFAWLSQTPRLITGTVTENIALGDKNPDLNRVHDVMRASGAWPLLQSLPQGMDTLLGEGGLPLSVGETQRLCVARAFYKSASILVLDEPTSSLDGPTEQEIRQALKAYQNTHPERAVLLVSHRLSTVHTADRVLVLKQGRIIETGTPKELWHKRGDFFNLFKDQVLADFWTTSAEASCNV